jgi:hypothetical protein
MSSMHRLLEQAASCVAPDRIAEPGAEEDFYAIAPRTKPVPAAPASGLRDLGQNVRELGRAAVAGKFSSARPANFAKSWIETARALPPVKIDHELSFERAEID